MRTASKEVLDAFDKEGLHAGKITVDLLKPRLTKAYVDDTKLTDHHAIIPTGKQAQEDLPDKERKVYELVLARFLSIFLPAERRDETVALFDIAGHAFRAKGVIIKDPGWTILEGKSKDKDKKAKDKDKAKKKDKGGGKPSKSKDKEKKKESKAGDKERKKDSGNSKEKDYKNKHTKEGDKERKKDK